MSLVGPRPERPGFVERYLAEVPGYAERFLVAPGLTGLAQVNGDYHSSPAEQAALRPRLHRQLERLARSVDPAPDGPDRAHLARRLTASSANSRSRPPTTAGAYSPPLARDPLRETIPGRGSSSRRVDRHRPIGRPNRRSKDRWSCLPDTPAAVHDEATTGTPSAHASSTLTGTPEPARAGARARSALAHQCPQVRRVDDDIDPGAARLDRRRALARSRAGEAADQVRMGGAQRRPHRAQPPARALGGREVAEVPRQHEHRGSIGGPFLGRLRRGQRQRQLDHSKATAQAGRRAARQVVEVSRAHHARATRSAPGIVLGLRQRGVLRRRAPALSTRRRSAPGARS